MIIDIHEAGDGPGTEHGTRPTKIAESIACPDLDPQWPRDGRPRGPTLYVLYPHCRCGREDAMLARRKVAART